MRIAAVAFLACIAGCAARTESAPAPAVPMYRPSPSATIPFRIVFENRMSRAFRFESIDLQLDGGRVVTEAQHAQIVEHVREGGVPQIHVSLEPGDHVLRTRLQFRGVGKTIAAYKFDIRGSRSFTASPGGVLTLIAYEQDGPLEERPAVRYAESGPPAPTSPRDCPGPAASAK